MTRFSDEFLDSLREQADIVGIIGEHVKLKRSGGTWRGPCPFHNGKGPNFSVDPRKGFYHCFKCAEAGTAVTFLQKHVGMEWADAVVAVANRSGIVVPTRDERKGPDPRERHWEVNAAAAEYFRALLWGEERGAAARAYLDKRAITRDVADRFQLGFAPYEAGLFRTHMETLGFDQARLLESGLLVKREELDEPRPRFRKRLMFPILDVQGHVAGFGGRALGDDEPKYLNSSEGDVFSKRRLLYGLQSAKNHIRRENRALVVEGYFDAIRLMAAGIESVVAPLGTALTDEQVALLTRYTKNIFLLYDSDEAGQKATFRSGLELLRAGASVRIVTLPDGEDPDSFVQANGGAALEALLGDAIDIFERQLQLLERGGWFADLHQTRAAIDKLLPTLRATTDALTRELYVKRLVERAGVEKETLLREIAADPDAHRPRGGTAGGDVRGDPTRDAPPARDDAPPLDEYQRDRESGVGAPRWKKGTWRGRNRGPEWQMSNERPSLARNNEVRFERSLVHLMLVHRKYIEQMQAHYGPSVFRDELAGLIYQVLVDHGPDATLEEIADALPEAATALVQQMVGSPQAVSDAEETMARGLQQFLIRDLREENQRLSRLLQQHEVSAGDLDGIIRQKTEVAARLSRLRNIPRTPLTDT